MTDRAIAWLFVTPTILLLLAINIFPLIWPIYLLGWLGAPGLLILFGGYMAFERVLRPFVERHIPELKEARAQAALKKAKSMMRKRGKR